MSKLKDNQFLKCTFCGEIMYDILLCERVYHTPLYVITVNFAIVVKTI